MRVKEALLNAQVAAMVNADRVGGVALAVAGVALVAFPDAALATGIGSWAANAKRELVNVVDFGLYGSYAAGLAATGIGISNAIKKSKGDNQVTTGSIFGYGLGGPAWMMLTYFAQTMAETMGGSGAQVYMPSGY